MPRLRSRAALLAAGGAALLASSWAIAADTWTEPHPGMRHLYRTTGDPLRIHALVLDLCTPGVSVRATKPGEKGKTPSAFGDFVNAEAVTNGDFYNLSTFVPTGMAMGQGEVWGGNDADWIGLVAFGPGRAIYSRPGQTLDAPPEGTTDLVSGRPQVVKDGAVADVECASHYCQLNPRTGVGFSRDRRTLYLVVVDGRSGASEGVTVEGLGTIMHDLGAYDALNLDGGGSSAMYIRGDGVVNVPSDGSQRVVANHLGLHANGLDSGSAKSCNEDAAEEAIVGMHDLDGLATTDVDGDGQADACARAALGLRCHLSSAAEGATAVPLDELSDEAGFDDAANWGTLRMGDVDGDRRADVCARTDAGIRCWPSTGSAFGAGFDGPALSDAAGWGVAATFSTLRLADVDGDGDDDLCGRSPEGFQCWRSSGDGFDATPISGPPLTDAAGWDVAERFGTLRMGDIDGDGSADLCGRAAEGMRCWLSDGSELGTEVTGPAWSDELGWSAMKFWSTIRLADVDGDARADLCARASVGWRCHLSTGTGFGAAIEGPALSDEAGWGEQANYLTLRMGDVNGDGQRDLCGRSDTAYQCWPWTGAGFGEAIAGPTLSDTSGWYAHKYFRTIRLADIDGDGLDDVCARGAAGLSCWRSEGTAFGDAEAGPTWSDENGWASMRYYATIRVAGPTPEPVPGGTGSGGGDGSGGAGSGSGGGSSATRGGPSGDGDDEDGGPLAGSGGSGDSAGGDLDGGCGCGAVGSPVGPRSLLITAAAVLGIAARRRRQR